MELIDATRYDNLPRVQRLLNRNYNLNAVSENGDTALHWAATDGLIPIGLALINAGANINA